MLNRKRKLTDNILYNDEKKCKIDKKRKYIFDEKITNKKKCSELINKIFFKCKNYILNDANFMILYGLL